MWKLCAANMATGRKASKPATISRSASSSSTETVAPKAAKAVGTNAATDIVETVRGLAQVVADHTLSELIVDLPEATITLRRGGVTGGAIGGAISMPVAMPQMYAAPGAPQASHDFTQHAVAPPAPAAAPAAVDDKSHAVTSPFVGTFYRRPNPDAAAYAEVGQRVDKGAVLCIVEAMKLMNEIEADVAGTVVAVLAEDGAAVEYGQVLFKIAPA
jgi:acetyl-CoA carboxylase biotin carboxyl carrier protein